MPTIFTRIIDGDIPGTFVWRDERCVAFMSINPMAYGHTLVVPIEEVDTGSTPPPSSRHTCSRSPATSHAHRPRHSVQNASE
jgi:histidine triad (HIT) family protein